MIEWIWMMLEREGEEDLPAQSAHASHPSSATQQQQRAAKHALFYMLEPWTSYFFSPLHQGGREMGLP
jgi:hypothetical protein